MTSAQPQCRFCGATLTETFIDLGRTPLANSYLTAAQLAAGEEKSYPLHARVCGRCFLVQVEEAVPAAEIFSDYTYFSSYSDSWVAHAKAYAEAMIRRLGLGPGSLVIEVASNDGYLLRHFAERGIPVLGIEPAANVAQAAERIGVPTRVAFFGAALGRALKAEGRASDLMVANNVLAHMPDIKDFVRGFAEALKPQGVVTFEFPHLLNLIEQVQFDTIYHEHYSYLSLLSVARILKSATLRVFDVEELPTHGGSLRVYVCHEAAAHRATEALRALDAKEKSARLDTLDAYRGFAPKVEAVRDGLLRFLKDAKASGKRIAAYGAAAKGNTMLNYCGVTKDLIPYVVDRNPAKQNHFLPGSHIPVLAPERLVEMKPDYVLILPWNLAGEVSTSWNKVREWGGKFVVAVPKLKVF